MPNILSVGIDIGTSTTQLVFSRITMENTSDYFSVPHVAITRKEVIYKSRVHLTPLLSRCRSTARRCAGLLAQALWLAPAEPLLERLYTPGSSRLEKLARLCFSGGVADCMEQTGQDPLRYGDIGILLGQSLQPEETIRATVVGAGSYTTSVSGSTITYSEAALFPLKNLPVLRLTPEEQALCLEGRGEELEEKIRWFLAQQDADQLILSLPGLPNPEYAPLQRLARALAGAAHRALPPGRPALVVLEQDMAKTLLFG